MPERLLPRNIRLLAGCLIALGLPATAATVGENAESCSAPDLLSGQGCALHHGDTGLSFLVHSSGQSSINQLTITPEGLAIDNSPVTVETDGVVTGAEIADLDANGWPEVYVYITSAGSGSYGSLTAYAVNNGKSMTSIYLPPLSDTPEAAEGYMGHDEFAVVGKRLVRRFPVYLPGDTNSAPGGGNRRIEYRLVPGESGWLLVTGQPVE